MTILVALGVLLVGRPSAARAGLILEIGNSVSTVPGSGTFDVTIRSDGAGTYNLAGFQFDLVVAPAFQIDFTASRTTTGLGGAPAYVFATSLADLDANAPSNAASPLPATSLIVYDAEASGARSITPASPVYALAQVSYLVKPTAPGNTVVPVLFGTVVLADDNAQPIMDFQLVNGSITLSAVPEPTSLRLSLVLLSCVLGRVAWRRRNRKTL
ncbi:MAG: hypothetical protein U0794_02085 [Isosphaeraceae bacterium]